MSRQQPRSSSKATEDCPRLKEGQGLISRLDDGPICSDKDGDPEYGVGRMEYGLLRVSFLQTPSFDPCRRPKQAKRCGGSTVQAEPGQKASLTGYQEYEG